MSDDLHIRVGFRPGFGQQPNATPEPALMQQPSQPADAIPDYAHRPCRLAPGVAVPGRRRPGRRPQPAGVDLSVVGVLHPGSIGQSQQRRHRQHQPMAGDAGRVSAPGLVPLPAQALDGLEAQFDPEAQGILQRPNLLRWVVSEYDPGFRLTGVPNHQQGAAAFGSAPVSST